MAISLDDAVELSQGDTEEIYVAFDKYLRSGELLTGTPTVVEVTTSDLTLGNKALNSGAVTVQDRSVAANKAVTFSISGQLAANSPYTVRITATTDATVARTKVVDLSINVTN